MTPGMNRTDSRPRPLLPDTKLLVAAVALAVLLLPGVSRSAAAQMDDEAPQATAELVADVAAVKPGQTFRLGVLYRIIPNWHIYWLNPGDSGMPTTIDFDLPDGFTISDLHWPTPRTFHEPGDLITFGYEDKVLLWAEVTVPDNLPAGETLTLNARSDWLVCKRECVMGGADLSLTLPVREQAEAANEALFEHWRKRLPVTLGDEKNIVTHHVQVQQNDRTLTANIRLIMQGLIDTAPDAGEHLDAGNINLELYPGLVEGWTLLETKRQIEARPIFHCDARHHEEEIIRVYLSFSAVILEATVHWQRIGAAEAGASVKLPVVVAYKDAQGQRRAVEVVVQWPRPGDGG